MSCGAGRHETLPRKVLPRHAGLPVPAWTVPVAPVAALERCGALIEGATFAFLRESRSARRRAGAAFPPL
jgi:hypothetical protein